MAITFQQEPLTLELKEELADLLHMHWEEIAKHKTFPLLPAWDRYFAMHEAGVLVTFTARCDGKLIGYNVFMVIPHLHYSTMLTAMQDILFIHPEHRRGSLGARLIKHADQELQSQGVNVVMHHMKASHNFAPLLERQGYELMDLIYTKRLN